MKTMFLEDVFAGYEVMALVHRNGWRLMRCQFNRKGARILYFEGWK